MLEITAHTSVGEHVSYLLDVLSSVCVRLVFENLIMTRIIVFVHSTQRGMLYLSLVSLLTHSILCLIIIIINLIYIAQFDTNGILTALYIVITYIQMQYVHVCTYAEQSYKYTYTCLHIHTYTVTCTNIHLPIYRYTSVADSS